jgi:hypothetical protein
MNKFFATLLINTIIFSAQANVAEHATCENAPYELTERERKICEKMKRFAQHARQANKTNPHRAAGIAQITFSQWTQSIHTEPMNAEAIKHIEAMLWENGIKDVWNTSHTFSFVVQDFLNSFTNALKRTLPKALFNAALGHGYNRFFVAPTTAPVQVATGGTVFLNFLWTNPADMSASHQAIALTGIVVGVSVIGGKIYWKMHEELPLLYFDSEEEIDEYLNSSQKAD